MAEFVQQSIEEMLPELEQMERVGLFTNSETRQILKKRKTYEYKLRRRSKCKEDFVQYIQYEINLLSLVKKRRQRIGYSFKKYEIDIAIVHRIHQLFRLVTNRFQDDVKLWLSHIEFSQKRREKSTVGKLFMKMLQIHNRKPDLWILAAKWEFEENVNPENARSLLQRGLRFNPSSKQLWIEYYRMELLYTEKLRKRREILGSMEITDTEDDLPDAVLNGLIADVVYKKAVEAFPDDVEFVLEFLSVCRLFDFTDDKEEQIYKDLREMFPDQPLTWDAVARRHLYQHSADSDKVSEVAEEKFYSVYEEAVRKVPGGEIWELYIKGCLELIERKSSKKKEEQRIKKLLDVFQQAANKTTLTPALYEHWLEVLTNIGLIDRAHQVAQLATSQHAKCVSLWKHFLRIMMRSSAADNDVIDIFKQALNSVAEKESLVLWDVMLDYFASCKSERIKEVLERGISSSCPVVSCRAKEFYLQWTFLTSDIHQTRSLYKRLTQMKPVTKELFQDYIKMELAQPKPKMKILRQVYEDALLELGSTDSDLWIDYIKLELSQPNGKPEEVGNIHFRAVKCLTGELNQRFITQYTLLQTGHIE